MPRLTVNLTDDQFENLKIHAANKSMSLSHYTNILIETGLRIEKFDTEMNTTQEDSINRNTRKKQMWETLLSWTLESRYLLRYMTLHGFGETPDQRYAIMDEAKEKAALLIKERFGDLSRPTRTHKVIS